MNENLKNKIAIITGSASGIGKATAILLAKYGAKVMVTDINKKEGLLTTKIINDFGGFASFYKLDTSSKEETVSVLESIYKEHGAIDLAVNNAGIGGVVGPLHTIESSTWERMMSICLSGVFYCMQEEIKYMLTKGNGRIVNVSSLAGLNGMLAGSHYSAAKHGVIGITKSAALEYGKYNIRVNSVCPGFVQTAILDDVPEKVLNYTKNTRIPMKRIGTTEEVAESILWLLSDRSSYINGESLAIDGGFQAG
jgi:NAD(P)-dependent dehydrogenase (short-subunit alcohol dehydrogenase family)